MAAVIAAALAAFYWGTRRPAIPPSVAVAQVAPAPVALPNTPEPPKAASAAAPAPAPEAVSPAPLKEPAAVPPASAPPTVRPPKVSPAGVAAPPLEPRREIGKAGRPTGGTELVPAPKPETPVPAPAEPTYAPPVAVSKTFTCRKAAEFNVSPEESHVLVEGKDIGIADDWDGSGGGKDYPLAVGSYVSCFILQDYKTACVRLTIDPKAGDDVCDVDTDLEKSK